MACTRKLFPGAGRADEEHVARFAEEAAGRQVEDLLTGDRRIERPIEVIERLDLTEAGGLHATFDLTLLTDQEFVLQHELQELNVTELMAGGFLQSHAERLSETG